MASALLKGERAQGSALNCRRSHPAVPTFPLHSPPGTLRFLTCLLLGFLLTAGHIYWVVVCIAPVQEPLKLKYDRLVSHDSYWFWRIADRGYQSPIPPVAQKSLEISNVAFFPAYPFWARFWIKTVGLEHKTGLLVAAHLATWGFWTYFLLLMSRWGFNRRMIAAGVVLVMAHPAAFFLICAYSESLFLMMMLGYFYWSRQPGPLAHALAAVHGGVMTATRIAGLPVAVLPVLQAFLDRTAQLKPFWTRLRTHSPLPALLGRLAPLHGGRGLRSQFHDDQSGGTFRFLLGIPRTAMAMTVFAFLGAFSFFLFCKLRFGSWDFYMQTQAAGWGVHADYLALLKPGAYARLWVEEWWIPWQMGQFTVPATMLTFAAMLWWEVRTARQRPTAWRERVPLYFAGFMLFFIAVSGVYSVRLESMIRYQFCTHLFLVLAGLHAFRDLRPESRRVRFFLGCAAAVWAALAFFLHSYYAGIFTGGGWVA